MRLLWVGGPTARIELGLISPCDSTTMFDETRHTRDGAALWATLAPLRARGGCRGRHHPCPGNDHCRGDPHQGTGARPGPADRRGARLRRARRGAQARGRLGHPSAPDRHGQGMGRARHGSCQQGAGAAGRGVPGVRCGAPRSLRRPRGAGARWCARPHQRTASSSVPSGSVGTPPTRTRNAPPTASTRPGWSPTPAEEG
jgi:hypothetical protein